MNTRSDVSDLPIFKTGLLRVNGTQRISSTINYTNNTKDEFVLQSSERANYNYLKNINRADEHQ